MSRVILAKVDWVVVEPPKGRPGPGADVVCTRCKRRDALPTPCPAMALAYFTRAFQEIHFHCADGPETKGR